jgi:rubrerythrin
LTTKDVDKGEVGSTGITGLPFALLTMQFALPYVLVKRLRRAPPVFLFLRLSIIIPFISAKQVQLLGKQRGKLSVLMPIRSWHCSCDTGKWPRETHEEKTMSPHLLLNRLLDFERRVRRLYLILSEQASLPAEVRFFWHRMAEDESHHLAILERSGSLLDLMESPPEVSETVLAGIEAKIAAAEAAVQHPDLSIDAALRQALILEGSEVNSLDEAWFHGFRPMLGSVLQAMGPEEAVHIRRLVQAVHTFSPDKGLQHQAAVLWSAYQHGRLGQVEASVPASQQ